VTPAGFRRLALSIPGAVEREHHHHPDFRAGERGKIFATLGYPDAKHAMIKLTPDQQADVLETDRAGALSPVPGRWGEKGATTVALAKADRRLVEIALAAAFANVTAPAPRPRGGRKRKETGWSSRNT
jgi:hypothetical protein